MSHMDKVLVHDIDFWGRVVYYLSPVQCASVARTCSAVNAAVIHDALYVRPKKAIPDHMEVTRQNCHHLQQAFEAGIRSFAISTPKLNAGQWYYRSVNKLCAMRLRRLKIDVFVGHYREEDNMKHDCVITNALSMGAYRQTIESLVVKMCSAAKNSFDISGMARLSELRLKGKCASVVVGVAPCTLQIVEATVSGDTLVTLLSLPSLGTAILRVEGPLLLKVVACSPTLHTLVLRATERLDLDIYAPGLSCLKLCVWTANVLLSGSRDLYSVVLTGHVWPVQSVYLDLGGARVENMRLHTQNLRNVVNARPTCLTVETFNDLSDIAPGSSIAIFDGMQIQVQVYGARRPNFTTDFITRLRLEGFAIVLKRAVIRDYLAIYLYVVVIVRDEDA